MSSLVSSLKRKLAFILPASAAGEGHHRVAVEGEGEGDTTDRAHKRRRLAHAATPLLVRETAKLDCKNKADIGAKGSGSGHQPSELLRRMPRDVLAHCLSYVNAPSDRFGLQVSCTAFRDLSNSDDMLATLELGGANAKITNVYSPSEDDPGDRNGEEGNVGDDHSSTAAVNGNDRNETSLQSTPPPSVGGIILDGDTSVSACEKLAKYAAAGNKQAIFMIAMILCYCHENISEGVALLRLNAAEDGRPHLPSVYALALILRDSRNVDSRYYLNLAASLGYAPAWQEKLTATEMRARFGDLDASKLLKFLDPPCLNRLLGRHYLECRRVRKCQTSHCWNPLCGRWAYKALRVENERRQEQGGILAGLERLAPAEFNDAVARLGIFEPANASDAGFRLVSAGGCSPSTFSIEAVLQNMSPRKMDHADSSGPSPSEKIQEALRNKPKWSGHGLKVSRMKMCSSCRRAKYCSKLCQVYDWRSGRHKMECQFIGGD
ncbi:hypothetical protein ACHAXT_010656 [Thalassiosira profunda]